MIRLLVAELRHDLRGFVGPLFSTAMSAFWVGLAAYFWFSIHSPAGDAALAGARAGSDTVLMQLAVYLLAVGIVLPSVIVLSSTGATMVAHARPRFAR